MPRVYVSKDQRRNARLAAWVYGQMKINRITQRQLAETRGVSQQAISNKLKFHKFDFEDFACFVELFKPDDSDLRKLIGGN